LTFFLDENIDAALAPQLRARGIDAQSVYDLRQQGWSDAALLQYSAEAGRVLVTHNIGDFVTLHRSYQAEGRLHAGIVVTQVRYIGTLLTRLVTLHETIPTEEMNNTFRFL
jgi:predicted nuclease of predicted toxin-antitoxin system